MMIKTYINEFVAITKYLLKSENMRKTEKYLIVKKNIIEELLDKNKYDTSLNKLKTWKALNWIDAEDRRVTRRVYNSELKKSEPCIKIDLKVYETLLLHNK